jgi:hypothetical protein
MAALRWADASSDRSAADGAMPLQALPRMLLGVGPVMVCYDDPVCCRCFRPLGRCPCAPGREPAPGCFAVDLEHVREPDGEDPECE